MQKPKPCWMLGVILIDMDAAGGSLCEDAEGESVNIAAIAGVSMALRFCDGALYKSVARFAGLRLPWSHSCELG